MKVKIIKNSISIFNPGIAAHENENNSDISSNCTLEFSGGNIQLFIDSTSIIIFFSHALILRKGGLTKY